MGAELAAQALGTCLPGTDRPQHGEEALVICELKFQACVLTTQTAETDDNLCR